MNPHGYEFCFTTRDDDSHARLVVFADRHIRSTLCAIPYRDITERAAPGSIFARPTCKACAEALEEWKSLEFDRGKEEHP